MKFLTLSTVFALAVATIVPDDVPTTTTTTSAIAAPTTLASVLRPVSTPAAPTGGADLTAAAAEAGGLDPLTLAFLSSRLPDPASVISSTPPGEVPAILKPLIDVLPKPVQFFFNVFLRRAQDGDEDARRIITTLVQTVEAEYVKIARLIQQALGGLAEVTSRPLDAAPLPGATAAVGGVTN